MNHQAEGLKEGWFGTLQAILMFAAACAANSIFYALLLVALKRVFDYLWG